MEEYSYDDTTYATYYYGVDNFQPNYPDTKTVYGYFYYAYHTTSNCSSPITQIVAQAIGPCMNTYTQDLSYRYSFTNGKF